MKRSRTEVGRWRMLRQVSRRKARWLEAQSRRNMRIHAIRKCGLNRHRNALLFAVQADDRDPLEVVEDAVAED